MLNDAQQWLGMLVLASGLAGLPARAGTYTTLYEFVGGSDGADPQSRLAYDNKGDLYGVAAGGGIVCAEGYDCGTLYELGPAGQETTRVTFDESNGANPAGPLTLVDHKLYGSATSGGGANQGVLFSVHANGSKFRLLHTFHGPDGDQPRGPMIPGPAGAFYGITSLGGPNTKNTNGGVLFELFHDGTYMHLHNFTGGADGGRPNALIIDASGTLYGSTTDGAPCTREKSCGVVFEYAPSTSTFTVLHQLAEAEGVVPMLGSVGPDGTLYGATSAGGGGTRQGSLFELIPSGGTYSLTTLYWFDQNRGPGSQPSGGPILTRFGDLIGTTTQSAPSLYRFKNAKIETLYTFPIPSSPAPPIMAKDGTIYGISSTGGVSPCQGVAYTSCGFVYSFLQ